MSITTETRRAAYHETLPTLYKRHEMILNYLAKYGEMNADELAERMYRDRAIPRPSRSFVAPRLTELKDAGAVETIGKSKSRVSGKMVAVWRAVKSCTAE